MENNIDLYGFYKRSNDAFVRWNNNDPAHLRRLTAMKHDVQYMASDTITVEIESVEAMESSSFCIVGDYIKHGGGTFRLNNAPAVRKTGERKYHYTYTFESVKYELVNVLFMLIADAQATPVSDIVTDDFTGSMFEFLKMIVNNANRVFGAGKWALPLDGNGDWDGSATLPIDAKTLTYDGQNCLYVLQNICEEWGTEINPFEYKIIEDSITDVKTIDIIERDKTNANDIITNNGFAFEYGKGNGLFKIERTASNSDSVITRLFCFGSSENLPSHYFATRLGLAKSRGNGTVGDKSLSYLDTYTSGGATITPSNIHGIREGVANFDDIKPHATWVVGSVNTSITNTSDTGINFTITIRQGSADRTMFDLNAKWKHYNSDAGTDYNEYLKLRNLADNNIVATEYDNTVADTYKYLGNGDTVAITFNSGDLVGKTFNLKERSGGGVEYSHSALGHRITLLPTKQENAYDPSTGQTADYYYPNVGLKPKSGDTFVFTGINLPWVYIEEAEAELLTRGRAKFEDVSQPRAAYNIDMASDFVLDTYGVHDNDVFECGKYLHIKDTALGLDKAIRLTQYSRDLIKGYAYTLTINDFFPRKKTLSAAVGTIYDAATTNAGTRPGENALHLNMEFTTAGNINTLRFYCINNTLGYGTLNADDGRRWLINNDTLTLDNDEEYNIFLNLNKTTTVATVSVHEAWLSQPTTQKAVIVEKNKNYVIWAGKISRITYTSIATQAYRTVEMWLGQALNDAVNFIGTTIKDADGNFTLNLAQGQTALEITGGTNSRLKFDAVNGIKMQKVKTESNGDESEMPCLRGDFDPTKTYDKGDIVRVAIGDPSDGNYASYRCVQDGTQQQQKPTAQDAAWEAMTPTQAGGGGGTDDYDQLNNRPTYQDRTMQTPAFFTGNTEFNTINGYTIFGNGNIEIDNMRIALNNNILSIFTYGGNITAFISNNTIMITL